MFKLKVIFLLTLAVSLFPRCLHASERTALQRGELVVVFDESSRGVADEVLREYPLVKAELEETFGWEADFSGGVRVVLLKEREFGDVVRGSPVVAFAHSGDGLIVMGMLRAGNDASPFRSIFKHELAHLYLGRHIDAERLPRWLNEGVSQWASGGVSELLDVGRSTEIEKATLLGRLIPLESLESGFPGDKKDLRLAYQESLSIVNFIVAEYGKEGLLGILDSLKEGEGIEEAVAESLRVDMAGLQRAWHARLRREHTLLTYLGENFYTLLFVLAALITVYGFARAVIRVRRYRDEDEDEGA